MAAIRVEFPHKTIIFTDWYQNMGHVWVRASSTISFIKIIEIKISKYYQPFFLGEDEMVELGKFYRMIFKDDLKNVHNVQDRVDDFLINQVPRLIKLLAFS